MAVTPQEDYPKWLTHELNTQRVDKRLCDVVLKCGTREFPAHRNVLCAASSYFNSLLDGGFTESAQQVIDVTKSFPNPDILEPVLKYVYTGQMDMDHVDRNNLGDLLEAVSFLLLDGAKNIVVGALTDSLMLGNCVEIFTLASKCNIDNLIELSARIIEARVPDFLQHGEALYNMEPGLLLNLLKREQSGFQYLSDTDALSFLKKYIKEWMSNHEEDSQLLISLKDVVMKFCPWFANKGDKKVKMFWRNLLRRFNSGKEKGNPASIRRKLENLLALENAQISDEAKFDRMADDQNDILIFRTEKKSDDGNESKVEVFNAFDMVTASWVEMFERTKVPKEPEYEMLGICNDFLILCDSKIKWSDLLAIPLLGGESNRKVIKSVHSCWGECDLEEHCCAHIFVAENSIFCLDPIHCCYEFHLLEQVVGYSLKKYNWETSEWDTCVDIPIPETFDEDLETLDIGALEIQHRDLRWLSNIQFMTAVRGSELLVLPYKHDDDAQVTHFAATTVKLNSSTGSYDVKTISVGELDWGGIDMYQIEPNELSVLVSDQENQIKVVMVASEYKHGRIASWKIETKEIPESAMSSLPRNPIKPEVVTMTRPRCDLWHVWLPLSELYPEEEEAYNKNREEYFKKMSDYKLSPSTGLVYCVETYGSYVNLTWKCHYEKNEDERSWSELPPPPTDQNVEEFAVFSAPRNVGQKLLALPRGKFDDPFVNEDIGPYNHTKYDHSSEL